MKIPLAQQQHTGGFVLELEKPIVNIISSLLCHYFIAMWEKNQKKKTELQLRFFISVADYRLSPGNTGIQGEALKPTLHYGIESMNYILSPRILELWKCRASVLDQDPIFTTDNDSLKHCIQQCSLNII